MKNVIANLMNASFVLLICVAALFQIKEAQAQEILAGIDADQRYCLQQNIYFEARNQSIVGKEAVAWVTLNRVDSKHYPDTICDVVWQNKQFSWTHDGKSDRPSDNVLEQRAWNRAGDVANRVLYNWSMGRDGIVRDAIMYHADYVTPYWAASYNRVSQVESHIFYR